MMHVGNPATLKKHPELFVKYFRGWIKRHPDFTKVKNMDDSILRKIAKEMNYKAGLN